MGSVDLVGKTISYVSQSKGKGNDGKISWSLDAIHFTDGTFLSLSVGEAENGYFIISTLVEKSTPKEA